MTVQLKVNVQSSIGARKSILLDQQVALSVKILDISFSFMYF